MRRDEDVLGDEGRWGFAGAEEVEGLNEANVERTISTAEEERIG